MPHISKMNVVHLYRPHHLVPELLSLTSDGIIGVATESHVYELFRKNTHATRANNGPGRVIASP